MSDRSGGAPLTTRGGLSHGEVETDASRNSGAPPVRSLVDIEDSITTHLETLVRGTIEAVEARIFIGYDLLEARQHFGENDKGFGQWCRRRFPWSHQWRTLLIEAARNEGAVRKLLATQVASSGDINFKKLVLQATNGHEAATGHSALPAPDGGTFSTIVIDPPWRYENRATRGAAEDHYSTMSLDELEVLEIPAASEAHLYLWTTNGFLREAFGLMESWGFAYKTVLTWCKPQIGLGNYFRNSTEHVLFGVRGRLATEADNIGTWFQSDRTKHSAKPELFYDLVEKASPGPYLEMFARRRRFGWDVWGAEA